MADKDKIEVPLMSTGQPSTLKNWYDMSVIFFGEESKATAFLKDKMDKQGEDEPVLSDEGQLIGALFMMDTDGRNEAARSREASGE